MQFLKRTIAVLVLLSTLGVPLGIAGEGYVCATGMRMDSSARGACERCALKGVVLDARARRALAYRSIGRPCCTYVASIPLPAAELAGAPTLVTAQALERPAPWATPSVGSASSTVTAPASHALQRTPDPDVPGSGVAPQHSSLLRL